MLEDAFAHIQEYFAENLLDWGVALIAVVVGYVLIRTVDASMRRLLDRVDFDRTLELVVQRSLKIFLWLLLATVVASNLGFDVSGFIAGLGIVGFIIGFAVKDVLSNLAAGMFLLIKRPFLVGDRINVVGIVGEVAEINLSCCILLSDDNETVTIPNAKIWGNPIRNLSRKVNHPTE